MSGAWDRARAQHGHPLHRDHTEDLETGIASAVREIDEMRAQLGRVREIADRAASVGWRQTSLLSVEQAEGMNQVGEEILRALEGDRP
ncbi:hypothetical protein ACWDTG_06815 [Rhodococcus zopfii]